MSDSPKPAGLLAVEGRLPLRINGLPAPEFIKRAYDLGHDLNGPGRFDLDDPIQAELRAVCGWIQMAEHDALNARKRDS